MSFLLGLPISRGYVKFLGCIPEMDLYRIYSLSQASSDHSGPIDQCLRLSTGGGFMEKVAGKTGMSCRINGLFHPYIIMSTWFVSPVNRWNKSTLRTGDDHVHGRPSFFWYRSLIFGCFVGGVGDWKSNRPPCFEKIGANEFHRFLQ